MELLETIIQWIWNQFETYLFVVLLFSTLDFSWISREVSELTLIIYYFETYFQFFFQIEIVFLRNFLIIPLSELIVHFSKICLYKRLVPLKLKASYVDQNRHKRRNWMNRQKERKEKKKKCGKIDYWLNTRAEKTRWNQKPLTRRFYN